MSDAILLDTDVASYLRHYEAAESLCGLQLLRAS